LAGPLGAIAGAALGHAFDTAPEGHPAAKTTLPSTDEAAQLTFFVAVFSMLAKLARADGHVSQEEIASIENFMVHDLDLNPESRRFAVNIFQTALESPETFDAFANQFYNQFRNQPQILEFLIDILFRVSVADGTLSEIEERLILSAVNIFGFSQERYSQIKSKYIKDVDKYYAILGSTPHDPPDQIKKQYRKLVFEYHPDKIAAKGLPEEFNKFAHDKFREIQEAWETIKKEKGIK
jgi:DnaJ like chaperone protein